MLLAVLRGRPRVVCVARQGAKPKQMRLEIRRRCLALLYSSQLMQTTQVLEQDSYRTAETRELRLRPVLPFLVTTYCSSLPRTKKGETSAC